MIIAKFTCMTLQILGTWRAQANVLLGISEQIGASEVLYEGPTNMWPHYRPSPFQSQTMLSG